MAQGEAPKILGTVVFLGPVVQYFLRIHKTSFCIRARGRWFNANRNAMPGQEPRQQGHAASACR